jgi:hypothetical protein
LATGVVAQRLEIFQTPAAMAAVEIKISGHRVAGLDSLHARAGLDDLAGDFMADDARKLHLPAPSLDVLDGQPGAAGDDACHRLAWTGGRIGPLFQHERRVRFPQHHGFHRYSPTLALSRNLACSGTGCPDRRFAGQSARSRSPNEVCHGRQDS